MGTALRSQLVGRVTELDAAREALASALSGQGKLVFVHGEAGSAVRSSMLMNPGNAADSKTFVMFAVGDTA